MSTRALQARMIDKTKDLNPLEIGFMAGIIDSAATFACVKNKNKKLLHWSIRVASHDAEFIVALRIMTGIGQFVELPKRKTTLWSVGVIDGFFLISKIYDCLQLKHKQAELLMNYREQTLISVIKNHESFAKNIKRLNAVQTVDIKHMDDMTFIGYFLGLFETKATAMMIKREPLLSISDLPEPIIDQIATRIGGKKTANALVWSGWHEFDKIHELTQDKLFSLRETLAIMRKYELGELKEEELRTAAKPKTSEYKKVNVKSLLEQIDDLAKHLRN